MTKKKLKKELEATKAELAKVQRTVSWGEYRNARYRRTIENLTGKKFVFGFDRFDRSMVEGNENTYDWFIPQDDNFGTYTKVSN